MGFPPGFQREPPGDGVVDGVDVAEGQGDLAEVFAARRRGFRVDSRVTFSCRWKMQRWMAVWGQCRARADRIPEHPSVMTTVGAGMVSKSPPQAAADSRAAHYHPTTVLVVVRAMSRHHVSIQIPSTRITSCTSPVTGRRGSRSQHQAMSRRNARALREPASSAWRLCPSARSGTGAAVRGG